MKLTRREFLAIGASLALSACGGSGSDEATDLDEAEVAESDSDAAAEQFDAAVEEAIDFDGSGLEEKGDFDFYISSSGGTSEGGNIPVIAWSPDTYGGLVAVNVYGGDGTVCTIYVDGHERDKLNAGDCSVTVTYDQQDGTEGTHLVELVSASDNGATIYRKAQYEIVY